MITAKRIDIYEGNIIFCHLTVKFIATALLMLETIEKLFKIYLKIQDTIYRNIVMVIVCGNILWFV